MAEVFQQSVPPVFPKRQKMQLSFLRILTLTHLIIFSSTHNSFLVIHTVHLTCLGGHNIWLFDSMVPFLELGDLFDGQPDKLPQRVFDSLQDSPDHTAVA